MTCWMLLRTSQWHGGFLAAKTAEEKASGPDPETTAPLDDKALLWPILHDLERQAQEG